MKKVLAAVTLAAALATPMIALAVGNTNPPPDDPPTGRMPIPGTLLLVGTGIVGLVGIIRRRRR